MCTCQSLSFKFSITQFLAPQPQYCFCLSSIAICFSFSFMIISCCKINFNHKNNFPEKFAYNCRYMIYEISICLYCHVAYEPFYYCNNHYYYKKTPFSKSSSDNEVLNVLQPISQFIYSRKGNFFCNKERKFKLVFNIVSFLRHLCVLEYLAQYTCW